MNLHQVFNKDGGMKALGRQRSTQVIAMAFPPSGTTPSSFVRPPQNTESALHLWDVRLGLAAGREASGVYLCVQTFKKIMAAKSVLTIITL